MDRVGGCLLNDNIIKEVRKENCFDFLRYFFAISLIIAHFCTLTETGQFWFISGTNRVKAFFTITGFLVTYSYLRRNGDIVSYARKRFLRIVPAYVLCVFFCLVLGMCVSTSGTADFVTDFQTIKYTVCNLLMMNWLEPELPNTFQDNFMPQMNGSLWSMKQEVIFYVLVPLMLYVVSRTRRVAMVGILAACVLAYSFVNIQTQYFMYFISGTTLLLFFDEYVKHIKWCLPLSVVLYLPINFIEIPLLTPFCASIELITFPMLLIGIAYRCRPLFFFRKIDNITYGLYLYHFPVIQTLIHYGVVGHSKGLAFFLTLAITFVLASVSWFCVEKRMMRIHRCSSLTTEPLQRG